MSAAYDDDAYWRQEDERFTRAEEEHLRLQADRAWLKEHQPRPEPETPCDAPSPSA